MGWLEKNWAEVIDFASLGLLFGPGAPDPDLGRFRIKVWDIGSHRGGDNVEVSLDM